MKIGKLPRGESAPPQIEKPSDFLPLTFGVDFDQNVGFDGFPNVFINCGDGDLAIFSRKLDSSDRWD